MKRIWRIGLMQQLKSTRIQLRCWYGGMGFMVYSPTSRLKNSVGKYLGAMQDDYGVYRLSMSTCSWDEEIGLRSGSIELYLYLRARGLYYTKWTISIDFCRYRSSHLAPLLSEISSNDIRTDAVRPWINPTHSSTIRFWYLWRWFPQYGILFRRSVVACEPISFSQIPNHVSSTKIRRSARPFYQNNANSHVDNRGPLSSCTNSFLQRSNVVYLDIQEEKARRATPARKAPCIVWWRWRRKGAGSESGDLWKIMATAGERNQCSWYNLRD